MRRQAGHGDRNRIHIGDARSGGGHQNVAGAQVKDGNLEEIKARAIALVQEYMKESDKDEGHTETGR